MRLDRAWIAAHIPHQGRMCLLDEVIRWDPGRISCRSGTHRDADHPLRAHGRLGVACGVEYAAQAMAVHGALVAGALEAGPDLTMRSGAADAGRTRSPQGTPGFATPAAGFLASVRGVQIHVSRLDDVRGDLICDAALVAGDRGTSLYEFELRSEARRLLTGRATVILDAGNRLHFP